MLNDHVCTGRFDKRNAGSTSNNCVSVVVLLMRLD